MFLFIFLGCDSFEMEHVVQSIRTGISFSPQFFFFFFAEKVPFFSDFLCTTRRCLLVAITLLLKVGSSPNDDNSVKIFYLSFSV